MYAAGVGNLAPPLKVDPVRRRSFHMAALSYTFAPTHNNSVQAPLYMIVTGGDGV